MLALGFIFKFSILRHYPVLNLRLAMSNHNLAYACKKTKIHTITTGSTLFSVSKKIVRYDYVLSALTCSYLIASANSSILVQQFHAEHSLCHKDCSAVLIDFSFA